MEWNHDWKALNKVLFPKELSSIVNSSLFMLLDSERDIKDGLVSTGSPFADRELKLDNVGKEKLDAMASKYGVDDCAVVNKNDLDIWVSEASTLGTNYFEQLAWIRKKLMSQIQHMPVSSRKNFVLELFQGPVSKLLPSRFNVLVFIDERLEYSPKGPSQYSAILLSYVKGKLDQFFEPDFSSLHENRLVDWKTNADSIGEYLESRYMLPCLAVLISRKNWQNCLEYSAQSRSYIKGWRKFIQFLDEDEACFFPKSSLTKLLVATQRIMLYFSKA